MARVFTYEPRAPQSWKAYAGSLLVFSAVSWLALYLILRTQTLHPFNPNGFHSGTWDLSFNTASSFVTNTNWQYYGGETTLIELQPDGRARGAELPLRRVGLVVAIALDPRHRRPRQLGNFWRGPQRAVLLRAAADLLRRRAGARLAGRRRSRSTLGRSPRRRSSRCSGPTAAGSSTSTPRCRSRTRTGSRTSSRCWRCSPSRPR